MAKQLIHIGVAVSTVGDGIECPSGCPPSGIVPGRSNIINIAAVCGEPYQFNENVIPVSGVYGQSPFWLKHPEELEKLKTSPVSLGVAMGKLRKWLKQFQGTLVACSSSVDFWHLLDAFFETGKDCPFGTNGVIDTNTVAMIQAGKQRPVPATKCVEPLEVAKARWELVTQGRLPPFGQRVVKPRKRPVRETAMGRVEEIPLPPRPPAWNPQPPTLTPPQARDMDRFNRALQRIRQQQQQQATATLAGPQYFNVDGLVGPTLFAPTQTETEF